MMTPRPAPAEFKPLGPWFPATTHTDFRAVAWAPIEGSWVRYEIRVLRPPGGSDAVR